MSDFSFLTAMGLLWGYKTTKPTPDRTANEEVAAFERHAARGIRHYLLRQFIKWTGPFIFAFAIVLLLASYQIAGVIGTLTTAIFAAVILYLYARFVWFWFRW